jgi:hypothetical protein
MRSLLPALMFLLPTFALAGVDTYGVGSGIDGVATIAATTTVNTYAMVSAGSAVGDSSVEVDDPAAFSVGQLVMIQRTKRNAFTSGTDASGAINLNSSVVGRYELSRVTAIAGTTLSLDQPLRFPVQNARAQVVSIPEYASLTVAVSGRIEAAPWDGQKGGVVAFLVAGEFVNNGAVEADERGFRGGVFVNQTSPYGCAALDYPNTDPADVNAAYNAGQKGEGLGVDYAVDVTGRGNRGNGAGGGNCHNAGGGGGSHRGRGGRGGNSWPGSIGTQEVGGYGGRPLLYSLFYHALFGGGGGSGD